MYTINSSHIIVTINLLVYVHALVENRHILPIVVVRLSLRKTSLVCLLSRLFHTAKSYPYYQRPMRCNGSICRLQDLTLPLEIYIYASRTFILNMYMYMFRRVSRNKHGTACIFLKLHTFIINRVRYNGR